MPAYSYVAVDAQGRTRRGVVEAEAPRLARAGLRSEGLVPLELAAVDPEAAAPDRRRWLARRRRLSRTELALVTRRFALLLEAGLTVEQCLDALIEQAHEEASGRILAAVRAEVRAGHGLAAALDRFPASFPDIYRALVGTGEQSGDLAVVMARLAGYLESRQAMTQNAGLALLYPAIVASVALLIVVGLLAYVVPQVVEVFQNSRQALPFLTRAMLWTSAALQGNWAVVAVLLAALAVGARVAWAREAWRARWQSRLLRLPVIGPLLLGIGTARLASTLAILVGGGVPLLQAIAAGARVLDVLPLRSAVEEAARLVREGSSLHRALERHRLFPPIFIHLVASGEASGRLAYMLEQAAKHQDLENERRIRLLTGILEPAIIVAMGIVVLLVVLAILLPIIEMNQLVRR
ncbi:MAG: type II secretion system inner membrane protein GspF [Betaproteobacteria bacterium]|nr:type II secretion system inner membrane protein GspF [Betaproteobacteria bacterium]MDH4326266.1 type II secretion system inner membrane protein GspF [Betaproteobacteria bacterium]MDH5211157.1 type II secretion system inner membrane protein GspF [Betaproteobacteria bacterium]